MPRASSPPARRVARRPGGGRLRQAGGGTATRRAGAAWRPLVPAREPVTILCRWAGGRRPGFPEFQPRRVGDILHSLAEVIGSFR